MPILNLAAQGDDAAAPLSSMAPTSFYGRAILTDGRVLQGRISVSNGIALIETSTSYATLSADKISKLIKSDQTQPGGINWPDSKIIQNPQAEK